MGLCLFLGIWGVQSFYLRYPVPGWICFAWTKIGLIGGIILLVFGLSGAGLVLLIGFPLVSWLYAVGCLVALATRSLNADGLGKPLDP